MRRLKICDSSEVEVVLVYHIPYNILYFFEQ